MKKLILRTSPLCGLVLLAGCLHLPVARHPRPVIPVPASTLSQVAYTRVDPRLYTETNLLTTRRYTLRRIVTPAAANIAWTNRFLELDWYAPRTTNPVPVILILPIIGGQYPLEKHFANYFATHGMAAVLVRRDKMIDPDKLEDIDNMLRQAAIDARQAVDWIETRPELDSGRIGAFGISLGAIRGAFLLPTEPRIRAATLGLVAGDVPWILTHTLEPGIARRRPGLLQKLHLTLKQLEEQLREKITCDPLTVAPAVDPRKVLLIIAACDTSVPSKKGWELRRAMGKPETILVPTGHYSALVYIPYIRSQCLRFFNERFAVP